MNEKHRSISTKSVHVVVPKIIFSDECSLTVGSDEIAIKPRSRQAKVFRFFWRDPSRILRRDDLISIIYDDETPLTTEKRVTIRFQDSLWSGCSQVLCRLRRSLRDAFSETMPSGTEWLPYSEDLEGWILYKLPSYGSDGSWH